MTRTVRVGEEPQGLAQEEEVGVVAHEGGRRAEVEDALGGGGDVAERVEVRHDVVLRLALVPVGGLELGVRRDEVGAQGVERGLGNREAELLLGLGEPEPEAAPGRELRPRREQGRHLRGRVARR